MFKIYFLIPLLAPLALIRWDFTMGMAHRIERWAARLAARPARAVALVGIVSFALSMGLSLGLGIPAPQVHDEVGYLLLGDTFAHGRVTNPTPPMWEHFESIHQIMRPTYTAKYPPAQGVALAIGEKLGLPIIGVWLTTALACAALCWMLLAWMPARWALGGGLMAALHPQVLEWSQDYWGGAVALGAGALVIGGFRRMLDEPRARDAVWMGLGLGLLANSRPYEGFVLGVLVLLALAVCGMRRGGAGLGVLIKRTAVPLGAVLLVFGAEIGYYNWRVTGSPLLMPYVLHERTYGIAPLFIFGKPRPEPVYRHLEIRNLQEEYLRYFEAQRSSAGALLRGTAHKIWILGQGYLWSGLLIVALLGLPWALARDPRVRLALLILALFTVAELLCTWTFTHFAAPGAGLLFVLALLSMRTLNAWRIGARRPGRNIVRGLAILFVLSFVQLWAKMAAADPGRWYMRRQALLEKLERQPDKSLVIVQYAPGHNANREWVYNEADIPAAHVIFARDMGPEQNRELVDFYRDRKVWVVQADAGTGEVGGYEGQ